MNGAAPDPGTFCFNAGNYDLKPETSIQIDGEVTANTKYVDASVSAFYNSINDYIYQRNLNNEKNNSAINGFLFTALYKGIHCLKVLN